MDEVPIAALGTDDKTAKALLGAYGGPAYVRRARRMEEAIRQMIERCERQRQEWLDMVRLRLGVLGKLAGEWSVLAPLLEPGEVEALATLHEKLRPELTLTIQPSTSHRRLRQALEELRHSIFRFNRRWAAFLQQIDLATINDLIDGYNRYYVFEKECVVGSPRVARQGFVPRPAMTTANLHEMLPPLPVPKIKP
jgi:hypothetical protein